VTSFIILAHPSKIAVSWGIHRISVGPCEPFAAFGHRAAKFFLKGRHFRHAQHHQTGTLFFGLIAQKRRYNSNISTRYSLLNSLAAWAVCNRATSSMLTFGAS
jgi:hypothetical protein